MKYYWRYSTITHDLFNKGALLYNYNDGTPVYDYKLKTGISSERLGMQIIINERIFTLLEGVIERQAKIE